ncbi:DUF2059 domain-containing protein [Aestuariicoccus sp. MJ-SS9]|uniref:DUF2059 domain-containing protein n=1 Tax=Aestuariicoccus sp. MJ-SS9 TaxID=3079855 RepID=UPI002907F22B|nr:DUF2059 domain-containing protein [Aestuariicoccus sp. MJ-SS9]MDU8913139.1 DUF2059 domain-containing protein [Aestuariicoccus sp. MJ-SS9]
MFLVQCLVIAACFVVPLAAPAEPADDLLEALQVPAIIDIMRDEGLAYGAEMEADLMVGKAGPDWARTISRIYDTDLMYDAVRKSFGETMPEDSIPPMLAFFSSDLGQRIVSLELGARRAMVDTHVEQEARAVFREMEMENDPRLDTLRAFVAANDLLEANVVGALNASYRFFLGLVDGGGFEMSEEDILADVWSQEEETGADTREWLYAYLNLAYGPLSDQEVEDYTALSETRSGRALNAALFAAFNRMYNDISYMMGLAAARQMQAQEL